MQLEIWKSLKHSLVSSTLVLAQASFGHIDQPRPVDEVDSIAGVAERNRAGYGWLNASSESEADAVFQEPCPLPGQSVATPCVARNSPLATYYHTFDNNVQVAATEIVKEKAFEYLALQMSAMGENNVALPSCLRNNSDAQRVVRAMRTVGPLNDDQVEAHIRRTDDIMIEESDGNNDNPAKLAKAREARNLSIKLRAVRAGTNIDRVSQAYMLEKQLKLHEDLVCPNNDDDNKLKCMSIRKNRHRIRLAFPVLFGNGGAMSDVLQMKLVPDGYLATETNDACGRNAYARFRQGIFNIMGAGDSPTNLAGLDDSCDATTANIRPATASCTLTQEKKRLVCRGQKLFRASVIEEQGYPQVVSSQDRDDDGITDGRWNRAFEDINDPTVVDPKKSRLASAKNDWSGAFTDLKDNYKEQVAAQITGLCRENTNLRSLATRYPNVVQQAVLDLEDQGSRDAMRGVMCSEGIMTKFQAFNQSLSCRGVRVRADGTVHVERPSHGFPFQSSSNYDIVPQADGSYKVKSKMNYRFVCDNSLVPNAAGVTAATPAIRLGLSDRNGNGVVDPDEFDYSTLVGDCNHQQARFTALTAAWVTQANTAFNSRTAAIAVPKVSYEISQCDATCPANQEPVINVSACYNHGTGVTDCSTVGRNWQDAGNYSMSTGPATIAHETGHALGLADEYSADYYPAHPLGEYGATGVCNSTMGSTGGACHHYYARHFAEIVRPAKLDCANRTTATDDFSSSH